VFVVPSLVQDRPAGWGHDVAGHPLLLHVTSHWHESTQLTALHDDVLTQSIAQALGPQVIGPHDDCPEQVISQPADAPQSIWLQALGLLHLIVQLKPGGHMMSPHALLELQSIRQVLSVRLQDVHTLGQARGTQYPRSQARSPAQSPSTSQVKPSDRRVTRQLVVDSDPSPMSTRSPRITDAFITDLPGS
jgi:hypothetical protein